MSYFLDRLTFFKRVKDGFSGGHGEVRDESRRWEDAYRSRWQHDKVVRSTHGVNCTGSCSWKIYVKNGLVTWETQQTDYPRTRPELPNHEPRGCGRGASYSWYIYSANRLKYPMIRGTLLRMWREARKKHKDPVDAWASIVGDPKKAELYKSRRGLGDMVRSDWDEVNELVASANIHTIKEHGPDRVIGFSPIPAMSMVSYAAGSRYMSLLGGVCMSFYDWYCDLPPSSPQTWGEQTDVPESADWYNAGFIMMWGSNVPQTRTPDAHFMTEVRYKGTEIVTVCPDYSEASKFGDIWLNPQQGTDSALGMALGHVILKEFHVDNPSDYFRDYARQYTDMPCLVRLEKTDKGYQADRFLRASDLDKALGQKNNPEWKTIAWDEKSDSLVVPNGSIGFRWGEDGQWNLEEKEASGKETKLQLSHLDSRDEVALVGFPYFGGQEHELGRFTANPQEEVIYRKVPVRKIKLADGEEVLAASVYDLITAHYGVDRGLDCENTPKSYDENKPYTPAWQEQITGVPRDKVIKVARRFADNANKTRGKSMIIIGAAMNHWYHMDMNYRSVINMLVFCGCIGQSGGGWAHYVGQEKLRPQTGWQPLAFALDWARPPRHMNSTSFFYAHTDQWRYEKLNVADMLSPLANKEDFQGSLIDFNVRSERMGWLPSAPQLGANPLEVAKEAAKAGKDPKDYVVEQLKSGRLRMACEDPDNPANFPRNLFVWRSNLLGSSGKGHEYFLKHLLGTKHGVQGKDLGEEGAEKPQEVVWREEETRGKLDLLTTLDFRMSTTCLYSDVVLPTATWYEKDDLNTSDMHPFIHPLCEAVNPCWESRTDWEIYKGLAKTFSKLVEGHLGKETDIVTLPLLHDSPAELGQALDVKEWHKGECDPIPGKTMPALVPVERDYPNVYARFTALGPLMTKLGNGGKGISWNTEHEVDLLGRLNGQHRKEGAANQGLPRINTAIEAADTILSLAPETNGEVAVKAWAALSKQTGRDHTHLALPREEEKLRFRDLAAQPRKIISSPTWSGLESEHVSYNAGYTNVHELIPWRTLSGRQQLYQDHPWMRAFGEGFVCYRPPVNMRTTQTVQGVRGNGNEEIALNWITPHQKWGIHSTYTDNLIMLTLSRGGPCVWISEIDAKKVGIVDNDWIECFNSNGSLVARAVVSQRVREGMVMMYHAQEKLVNTPGSEITGERGGIHNSVTRAVIKPTHMIGGYAQLSYGFNYYGTVGSNRDEFVVVRKMDRVDWLDGDDESIYDAEEQA
ncbi:nitrate reductase subunit alpha [Alkalilimnicola ehrlichii MLHE-1]|uniref:nitrate reductase (quinone) n=1 Tax=Alkalilimnicola ehrlichii (strain ATCC BAA-1101 / DSM 17681 / MLHE-1) TaxID=187272 RepID=Q0A9Y1_ALKEH|nr:nitrate reductase subunit alpha [Alkalilimnicola ehrlichii]ABI56356.1 respiratory nitrate reductase alpha subunit apoprotein [Alkalilimnicola ehrlichii MLHE-1]